MEGSDTSEVGHVPEKEGEVFALWPPLVHAMETELCRIHDQANTDGVAKRPFWAEARV